MTNIIFLSTAHTVKIKTHLNFVNFKLGIPMRE
jgi:hypothetical protein